MGHLRVATSGPGRPRTRPEKVRGDKAYSSKAIRTLLAKRGITAVIPQPDDQISHRKWRRSFGGRPPSFDAEDYKGRNVVERSFQRCKQWRGVATRYDKHNLNYRGGAVLNAYPLAQKVMGHALAVFGAPNDLTDHADAALKTALVIDRLVGERFGQELRIGIGINTGVVIAGTIGGGGKLEFTLIGNAVNVAQPCVEQLTKIDR